MDWKSLSCPARAWIARTERPYPFASPCPGEEFALLLVVGDEDVTAEEQDALSRTLVRAGCRYAVCWGHACSTWDDSIDWVGVMDEVDGREPGPFVMTTWHEGESLGDVAEFLLGCTSYDDFEATRFVVLVVGGRPALEAEAARAVEVAFREWRGSA